jgi:hypothetical protein
MRADVLSHLVMPVGPLMSALRAAVVEMMSDAMARVLFERTTAPVSLICASARYPDVAVAPAKALVVEVPHASIHRD